MTRAQVVSAANWVSPDNGRVLTAFAQIESGFDPSAVGADGEIGLMQILPATARGLGYDPPSLLFDPDLNLRAGLLLIQELDRQLTGPEKPLQIISAYNCGPSGTVSRCYSASTGTFSNQTYVDRFVAALDETVKDLDCAQLVYCCDHGSAGCCTLWQGNCAGTGPAPTPTPTPTPTPLPGIFSTFKYQAPANVSTTGGGSLLPLAVGAGLLLLGFLILEA